LAQVLVVVSQRQNVFSDVHSESEEIALQAVAQLPVLGFHMQSESLLQSSWLLWAVSHRSEQLLAMLFQRHIVLASQTALLVLPSQLPAQLPETPFVDQMHSGSLLHCVSLMYRYGHCWRQTLLDHIQVVATLHVATDEKRSQLRLHTPCAQSHWHSKSASHGCSML
jgi:hypothetical protein